MPVTLEFRSAAKSVKVVVDHKYSGQEFNIQLDFKADSVAIDPDLWILAKTKISKKIAPDKHVDLIVCGATGLNAVERILIGSVSQHILRYAKCDVLIVRTPKEAEEESKPLQVELTE